MKLSRDLPATRVASRSSNASSVTGLRVSIPFEPILPPVYSLVRGRRFGRVSSISPAGRWISQTGAAAGGLNRPRKPARPRALSSRAARPPRECVNPRRRRRPERQRAAPSVTVPAPAPRRRRKRAARFVPRAGSRAAQARHDPGGDEQPRMLRPGKATTQARVDSWSANGTPNWTSGVAKLSIEARAAQSRAQQAGASGGRRPAPGRPGGHQRPLPRRPPPCSHGASSRSRPVSAASV